MSPAAPQFPGVPQGIAGAGLPPGQKKPGAHCAATADVDPAAHPKPGAALQGPLHVGTVLPAAAP